MEWESATDQSGGAREGASEVGKTVEMVDPVRRSLATTVDTATSGAGVATITVGLIWQAQAQSAECAR